jgi:hypothetical protein
MSFGFSSFLKRKFIRSPFYRQMCVFACAGSSEASLLPQTIRNSTLHPLSVTKKKISYLNPSKMNQAM